MDATGETGELVFGRREPQRTVEPTVATAITTTPAQETAQAGSGVPGQRVASDATLISVDAEALRQILQALTGPGHHIRELQATRSLVALGIPNPIDTLLDSYNAAIAHATKEQP